MLGFFVAFAVKLPVVPLHTWLPDAHTEAPTAGSVILAGLLLKTGAYGLLRFVVPLFPAARRQFRSRRDGARRRRHPLRRDPGLRARPTSSGWSPTPASATWASCCSASSPGTRSRSRAP